MKDYVNVSIPEKLHNAVQEFINSDGPLGYRNVSEFVIEAVRNSLKDAYSFNQTPRSQKASSLPPSSDSK